MVKAEGAGEGATDSAGGEGGMTFNQWAAGKNLDTPARMAFEAVWNELTELGSANTSLLLTDLFEEIPEFDLMDEEDLF
jgi:hypothetical protein